MYAHEPNSQNADSLYKRPLKDVLRDVQRQFGVRLKFAPDMVDGRTLAYADWRIRPYSVEQTLANVLAPFDMKAVKEAENTYKIKYYEYPRRTLEEGKEFLSYLLTLYSDSASWEARRDSLRACMFSALGLSPMPESPGAAPILTKPRKLYGYTVENFALEVLPGVYVCGSIYKPLKSAGLSPVILNPNGHFGDGRYRADQQLRCAMQARMGAIAASYDLFAWGESLLQFQESDHRRSIAHTIQTLNAIRILDYLCTLKNADPSRVAITGGSGGGSQTMLISAIDNRVKVSIPVVMLSSYFMGGCPCESGMPVHLCGGGTSNVEMAAMFAPRPQLALSDGKDWTSVTPEVELPFLQKIYGFYGKPEQVKNVHFADEGHDYGLLKRKAAYLFLSEHLGLSLNAVTDKNGNIDESKCTVESRADMLVFGVNGERLPKNAVKGVEKLQEVFNAATRK
ncbi:MAG: acetylxylan esterase [Prevotellaceae bacterium]|nr:acetylxylan esterase [Prevotellaceae bacterium]